MKVALLVDVREVDGARSGVGASKLEEVRCLTEILGIVPREEGHVRLHLGAHMLDESLLLEVTNGDELGVEVIGLDESVGEEGSGKADQCVIWTGELVELGATIGQLGILEGESFVPEGEVTLEVIGSLGSVIDLEAKLSKTGGDGIADGTWRTEDDDILECHLLVAVEIDQAKALLDGGGLHG
jgi:hypothetical protein